MQRDKTKVPQNYDIYRRYRLSHFYGDFTQYMVDHDLQMEDSVDFFREEPKFLKVRDKDSSFVDTLNDPEL